MDYKQIGGKWVDTVRDADGKIVVVEQLEELDRSDGSYVFDSLRVWKLEDGRLFYATDSGCSCPSPFEDVHTLADLTPITATPDSLASFERELLAWVVDSQGCSRQDCLNLIDRVKAELKATHVKRSEIDRFLDFADGSGKDDAKAMAAEIRALREDRLALLNGATDLFEKLPEAALLGVKLRLALAAAQTRKV